ncbi:MAG: F0F1 ATP synthase subunit B [Actinomycetota bacterium]|nr:F0F1 ATP synthase subunit B [Actinomycetota bacterium]|tara:strand:+ start:1580 stop:2314 length:735 start_codon:yes stop_codon:yes gene_type:complete
MTHRRTHLLAVPLVAALGLVALAGPAGASGESIGGCIAHHLEEMVEHLASEGHTVTKDRVFHELHEESTQEDLEACLEAPNPILPELNEIIWGGAAFLILLVVMVKKGFPAVKGAMDARAERIQADLDAAETAKSDAQAIQADYEERLADAKGEAARLFEEARTTADQLKADLTSRAEADVVEMRERATADIEASRQQAIADLRAEVAGIALGAAERVVQSSLDEDAQRRLIDQYIDEVSGHDD